MVNQNRFIIVRMDPVWQPDDDYNEIDTNHPNFSPELDRVLYNMPIYQPYIGCIGCGMPVAYQWEICDAIANSRHPDLIVAYVVPIRIFSLMLSTMNLQLALNHWETKIICSNCNINLNIPALTIYNRHIADYQYNDTADHCVIMDSECVEFFQREREYK